MRQKPRLDEKLLSQIGERQQLLSEPAIEVGNDPIIIFGVCKIRQ